METFGVLHVPHDWNTVRDVERLDGVPRHYLWKCVVAYRARPIAELAGWFDLGAPLVHAITDFCDRCEFFLDEKLVIFIQILME